MHSDDSKTSLPSVKTEKNISSSPKTHASSSWILATLSLLLAIITAVAVIYIFKKNIEPHLISSQRMLASEKALLEMQRTISAQQKILMRVQKELRDYRRATKIENVNLTEAEYLVKLAMFNLSFESNATVARQLLQTADEKIRASGTIGWPIRQALAKDIAALDAVPKVDLPGVVSRLNALSEQVETLPRPLSPIDLTKKTTVTLEEIAPQTFIQKLRKIGQRIGEILGRFVIVTSNAPEAQQFPPLLPPDQYLYVVTNIQSQLSMAEWAVLYQQPEIYKQSLDRVKNWTYRYFVNGNEQTIAFLKSLSELMLISVKPNFPDLSNTLNAILEAKKIMGLRDKNLETQL